MKSIDALHERLARIIYDTSLLDRSFFAQPAYVALRDLMAIGKGRAIKDVMTNAYIDTAGDTLTAVLETRKVAEPDFGETAFFLEAITKIVAFAEAELVKIPGQLKTPFAAAGNTRKGLLAGEKLQADEAVKGHPVHRSGV